MSVVLLIFGVLMAAVGAVMVGFGVPINEFSLGNTLIIAGTTEFVGGMVVVALSVASRHLSRIAELLKTRGAPAPLRTAAPEVAVQSAPPPAPAPVRLPFPPRGETREPARAAEPQPAESEAAPHDPIFDRLRMAHMAARRTGSEPPMVEGGEASLSPNGPPRAPVPPPVPEPVIEPRGFRPPDLRAPKSDERSRGGAEPARGPAPSAPAAAFEDAWPAPSRPSRGPAAEPASRELPAPRSNGSARHEEQIHQSAIAVLKSGIVDGMAYTLYTDGSIEAELAQGVVRFGSIEELRNHLEKGG